MTDKDHEGNPPADYEVGYRQPPVSTRFRRGRSGNPKGRPKGSKDFRTEFAEELAQPITLSENGRRKQMPKRRAIAKQLINKALTNDPRAASLVLDQISRSEGAVDPSAGFKFDRREDARVIASIVRRIRLADAPSNDIDETPPSENRA